MPNTERSRPPAPVDGSDFSTHAEFTAGLPELAAVRAWAAPILDTHSGTPTLGSSAWCELDDDDPLRVVAAVRAGVAWVVETWSLPERLAADLRAADLDVVARVRSAGLDVADGTEWSEQSAQIRRRADWIATHPWTKRVTA